MKDIPTIVMMSILYKLIEGLNDIPINGIDKLILDFKGKCRRPRIPKY